MDPNKRDEYQGATVTFALEGIGNPGKFFDIAWIPAKDIARVPVVGDHIVIDSPNHAVSGKDGLGGGHGTRYVVTSVDLGFIGIADENGPVQYWSSSRVRVLLKTPTTGFTG